MRMDISKVAKRCGELEDEREIVSREVQELRGAEIKSLATFDFGIDGDGAIGDARLFQNFPCFQRKSFGEFGR